MLQTLRGKREPLYGTRQESVTGYISGFVRTVSPTEMMIRLRGGEILPARVQPGIEAGDYVWVLLSVDHTIGTVVKDGEDPHEVDPPIEDPEKDYNEPIKDVDRWDGWGCFNPVG